MEENCHIFLYGPPGSGKSSLGAQLSQAYALPFYDLDALIEAQVGATIPQIFSLEGESGFRQHESDVLGWVVSQPAGVVALGGGTLLSEQNRKITEDAGKVICLTASFDAILERLNKDPNRRPLLDGESENLLKKLLEDRHSHYASFPYQIDAAEKTIDDLVWDLQALTGLYHVKGMGKGYDVRVHPGSLNRLGAALAARGMKGPVAVVTDANVGPIYAERVVSSLETAGFSTGVVTLPAGEAYKNIETINKMWDAFLEIGMERGSTVLALGGGVVGDMAGFAAATYMRGVHWVVVPTTLLAMVDASLGGKTGVDLPKGKNLVGAFYPPGLVWVDIETLDTLPVEEIRNGMAEIMKHGVIADPMLFTLCRCDLNELTVRWHEIVPRAMAVKMRIIQEDPFERGARATLNLGHTLGHAIEVQSGFKVKHGEAVAIGMVAAARAAERLGIAQPGLAQSISEGLESLGLPVDLPSEITWESLFPVMHLDKKVAGGKIKMILPVRIGECRWGVALEDLSLLRP